MPSVKIRCLLFRIENFKICSSSISLPEMRDLRGVIVCLPDEKTRSQGTLEAWIGMISIAKWKM
jgi:hypothetical protein